ncbi:MAG TPA: ActS/PrrB/RegB family redox-sensitive histidine kinase [Paracoccaceae bacterium]|nr:ActS/PrrB/RegB family redox-sensitive histidine kinase [Paracoccaceae bacterium]
MSDATGNLVSIQARSQWVRLRTLIFLRWMAVLGQTMAVIGVTLIMDVQLHLDYCLIAISLSAAYNIVATVIYPENKRLTEKQATVTLLFDLFQLGFLLFLTGGLNNPFVVLLLVPVTISSTALTLRATLVMSVAAVLMIALLSQFNMPLVLETGEILAMPSVLIGGTAASLIIAVIFLSGYARTVAIESFAMSQALTATQMALGREQRLKALGGVVAAAAHELGTPLATIKLVSAELADELADRPDLKEDVELINSQADRCRDILRDMGRAGKDDTHLQHAMIQAVVEEAAEPHKDRGKRIILRVNGALAGDAFDDQPEIPRQAEIIHGLRNLVQNAVDFAFEMIWVDITWDEQTLRVRVGDDGMGYPTDVIGRIGDPFVRKRNARQTDKRPGYEGMGLGLFIAKTLLERSGATLTFANGTEEPGRMRRPPLGPPEKARPNGAIVEVAWQRGALETHRSQTRGALGENIHFAS